ncbi:hypothetical protein NYZ99_15115 [Maribacter litopenaei]|uniref:Cellulose-binding Sde182 C-terminal domain-containing protein n=1 Tax=Maribacter litopenaei TaxID=2976127 RepID=A0ABY5Y8I0_9FLAO|nr:hypothetical protein [Maribacter litopenaei]UWX54271.1 hypothetical protein NYZ99_15115 [Maribacter litopenaei]
MSLKAKPGEQVIIDASVTDPDGDEVDIKWWYFPVGTYQGDSLSVDNPKKTKTTFTIPRMPSLVKLSTLFYKRQIKVHLH